MHLQKEEQNIIKIYLIVTNVINLLEKDLEDFKHTNKMLLRQF